jgi:hypothetical protein
MVAGWPSQTTCTNKTQTLMSIKPTVGVDCGRRWCIKQVMSQNCVALLCHSSLFWTLGLVALETAKDADNLAEALLQAKEKEKAQKGCIHAQKVTQRVALNG